MAVGAGELDRLDALDDGAYRLEIRDWAENGLPHRPAPPSPPLHGAVGLQPNLSGASGL